MSKKRIGILTSGGDCPGLNAVIRGTVKASHQLGYDCVGFLKGYEGLYDPVQYVHLTPNSTRGILNQGGTILGSTNKGRFAATVGVDDRQELDPQLVEGVKQTIDQLSIDGLICVGGDGSLAVAQQFHENGIPVVGVPKTIDNDLSATAFTFGFDSAIECATDALDRLHTTAASHERIMVLEVMGRHAGWIALHSGIAGGGDVILLPEIPWTWDHLCHKIMHRESQGKKFTLVVVAEGAELPGGELVGEERNGQQMKLGGVGRAVTEEIERRLHRETRLSVLGHLQRGGKPTTFDRVLATQFGAHAVRLVHEGRFGEMICSRPPEMNSVPIMEAVNVLRRVDPHGPAVQAARALGISFGDRAADEVGENVFNLQDTLPLSHVDTPVEEEAFDDLPLDLPAVDAPAATEELAFEEPVEEAAGEAVETEPESEATPVVEEVAEAAAEEPEEVAAAEAADLTVEVEEEETEEAAAEASEEEIVVEVPETVETAPAETVSETAEEVTQDEPALDPVAEADGTEAVAETEELAEGLASADVAEEAAEQPAAEVAVEADAAVEAAAGIEVDIDVDVAVEITGSTDEPVADEDSLAEEVAETILDMTADADEAIHGAVADPDEPAAEPEPVEPPAEIELPETDALAEEATEAEATEQAAEETLAEEASAPLEEAIADPGAALEVEEASKPAAPTPDLSAMQDDLAAQIAAAAKDSRDNVPEEASLEAEVASLDVADLVQQKLAAAEQIEEQPVEDKPEPVAAASVLEQPHGEDLVAEARAALEDALAD